jgi:hypothetical protein
LLQQALQTLRFCGLETGVHYYMGKDLVRLADQSLSIFLLPYLVDLVITYCG